MSLSFNIAKPTKSSTIINNSTTLHSSDEEKDNKRTIQFISHFDSTHQPTHEANGNGKNGKEISIEALPDRDFRAIHLARKSKRAQKEMYKPDQMNSMGGAKNGTTPVGQQSIDPEGLDKMNSKTIEGGLKPVIKVKKKLQDLQPVEPPIAVAVAVDTDQVPQTIEERAVKELLSRANDSEPKEAKPIEAIHMPQEPQESTDEEDSDDSGDETAQFRKDVSKRPDCSTLEDYERIPVGQFGLALLKGMGWKEGTAATKKGRVGLVEAYVPQPRPSLLGIGAKPLAVTYDLDPTSKKTHRVKPDKKYVPLLRKVIDNGPKTNQDSRSQSPNQESRSETSRSRSYHKDSTKNGSDRSSYQDSRNHKESTGHGRDSRDIDRRDYERSSRDRYDSRDSYSSSRKYDSSSSRSDDHRSRSDYPTDKLPPATTHRSSSSSASYHLHSSSTSRRNYHLSTRDQSKY